MKRSTYSDDFRQSIVNLYQSGKPSNEILNEYELSSSTFYKWVKKHSVVKISGTESMTMTEIKSMQKRLALLEEENMILKKRYPSSQRWERKSEACSLAVGKARHKDPVQGLAAFQKQLLCSDQPQALRAVIIQS
ncbi:MAG: transposase [Oscillospiraceae bacterium]